MSAGDMAAMMCVVCILWKAGEPFYLLLFVSSLLAYFKILDICDPPALRGLPAISNVPSKMGAGELMAFICAVWILWKAGYPGNFLLCIFSLLCYFKILDMCDPPQYRHMQAARKDSARYQAKTLVVRQAAVELNDDGQEKANQDDKRVFTDGKLVIAGKKQFRCSACGGHFTTDEEQAGGELVIAGGEKNALSPL